MENFSSLASAIAIEFECVKCGFTINETFEELPIADIMADNIAESENSEEETIFCPDCGREYICAIFVNQNEGNVEVSTENGDVVDDIKVESIFSED